jgi:hypothetical protein
MALWSPPTLRSGRRERSVLAGRQVLQWTVQRAKTGAIVLTLGQAFSHQPLAVYDFIARQIGAQ